MNRYYNLGLLRANLPRLTLSQHVVDKIVANALRYPTETGESLVGVAATVQGRPEPDLFALETISPDADTAVRRGTYFEQGGFSQNDMFNWYYLNWEQARARRNLTAGEATSPKWNAPLADLGDWHKHPGALTQPSSGDFDTAYNDVMHPDLNLPQLLVVLATVWDRQDLDSAVINPEALAGANAEDQPKPLVIPVDAMTSVRIDTWYMSRLTNRFVLLAPIVADTAELPSLPPLAWYLQDHERMTREAQALQADGYASSVRIFDADNVPPLEICLTVFRMNGKHIFVVVTGPDYPAHRPTLRYAPIGVINAVQDDSRLFEAIWAGSQPLPASAYPDWEWTADRTIYDLVTTAEARLSKP